MKDEDTIDSPPLNIELTRSGQEVGGNLRVWFAANVVRIGGSLRPAIPYGYDSEKSRIFDSVMSRSPAVTLFSDTEMAGCQRGRIVF
jgi:hypothetical protein